MLWDVESLIREYHHTYILILVLAARTPRDPKKQHTLFFGQRMDVGCHWICELEVGIQRARECIAQRGNTLASFRRYGFRDGIRGFRSLTPGIDGILWWFLLLLVEKRLTVTAFCQFISFENFVSTGGW